MAAPILEPSTDCETYKEFLIFQIHGNYVKLAAIDLFAEHALRHT